MRLKSIKLAGFKSFVDATTVPFATNMTAIVGPNGCGKSNIIDAVRWVMGESSAKNLRGENMTDVIFNGSTGRQPVGQASIELLFDNSEGRLTGEYAAFSEISIKRKVTREGVSQYYLNGSKCRRRDVTDIFLGTGMGPRSYAIIEQGMISKLIESKPEDLRVYLEEAAGISKYKERRRETENRMRRTQDNLDRLSDIREELDKQLQHLKKQANAAERYAEFKQEERLLRAKLNAIRWQVLAIETESKAKSEKTYEQKIEDALLARSTNENQIDSLRTRIDEDQQQFNQLQAKYYQSGAEIASLEQKLQYEKNRLSEQQQTLDLLRLELVRLNEKQEEDEDSLAQVEQELDELRIEFEQQQIRSEDAHDRLDEASRKLDSWQSAWEAFNATNADARQTAELAQNKIQQYENRLRELSLRAEKLETEKGNIQEQITTADLAELNEEALLFDEQIHATMEQIDILLPHIQASSSELELAKENQSKLFKTIAEEQAVLASLKTLQQGFFGDHSQKINEWCQAQGVTEKNRLLQQLSVEAGWEAAVEQVLSNWLDAIVLTAGPELDKHESVLSKLDQCNAPLSLIFNSSQPLSTVTPNSEAERKALFSLPRLSTFVKGADSLSYILDNIFTVESLEIALQHRHDLTHEMSIITPEGIWLGKNWVKKAFPEENQTGLVFRAKKIQSLEENISKQDTLYHSLSSKITQLSDQLVHDEAALSQHQARLQHQESEKRKIEQLIATNQAKLDQFKLRLMRSSEDLDEVKSAQEEIKLNLEEARCTWQEAMTALEDFAEEREQRLLQKEEILNALEEVRVSAKETQNRLHQHQLTLQQKENQRLILTQALQRSSTEISQKQEKVYQITHADQLDDAQITDLKLQLEGLLETRLYNEQKLSDARTKLEESVQRLRDEEGNRNNFEGVILAAREALNDIRMDLQALRLNQQTLLEKIQADDFKLEDIIEALEPDDKEPIIQQNLDLLANKITRLGSINLAAIEEYKVQSQRKEHLDAQHEDLIEALETLMAAIRKIDKETRTRFKETFDQVNEGLQKLFPKIFGGGNAYLELTDDNLLETGVQIIARPPGKKNATIHLLSGGEKSLTAIALIFAIFELNPAPFCMLDEVDAPLDDANVGRFANIVKEMSAHVQFIYISHNKVSMERADQLMGVTMHEPGVSRLVSVDIEQAAAMVESA